MNDSGRPGRVIMNSRDQALALGVAIDALVVISVTVLGALHVIPGEAIIGLLGTLIGARAMRGRGGNDGQGGGTSSSSFPPPAPSKLSARTVAEFSTVAALAGLIFTLISAHFGAHHHGGEA